MPSIYVLSSAFICSSSSSPPRDLSGLKNICSGLVLNSQFDWVTRAGELLLPPAAEEAAAVSSL